MTHTSWLVQPAVQHTLYDLNQQWQALAQVHGFPVGFASIFHQAMAQHGMDFEQREDEFAQLVEQLYLSDDYRALACAVVSSFCADNGGDPYCYDMVQEWMYEQQ